MISVIGIFSVNSGSKLVHNKFPSCPSVFAAGDVCVTSAFGCEYNVSASITVAIFKVNVLGAKPTKKLTKGLSLTQAQDIVRCLVRRFFCAKHSLKW
jgi:hypothetical protein